MKGNRAAEGLGNCIELLEGRKLLASVGPDLVGSAFEVQNPTITPSWTVSVRFSISNRGISSAMAGAFDVSFYWSGTANLNSGGQVAANLSPADPFYQAARPNAVHYNSLGASSTTTRIISIETPATMPVGSLGMCYLGIRVDEANTVAEYDETNNSGRGANLDSAAVFWQTELYAANLDTVPLWSLGAGWAYGTPSGAGGDLNGDGRDPIAGFTGSKVIGTNLAGAYAANMAATAYAALPAISTVGYTNVSLGFRRWLNIEGFNFDQAIMQASTDNTNWTTLWTNPNELTLESDWSAQICFLPAGFADRPAVYFRFGIGPTDQSIEYGGWNIDDVVVRGLQATAAPGVPDLISDTGVSGNDNLVNLDNSSAAKRLTFSVPQTIAGATVSVFADGQPVGSAAATGTSTTVLSNGSVDLADGAHQITASQTAPGKGASPASAALGIQVDTQAPTVTTFQVNGGAAQRSMVKSADLTFSEAIASTAGIVLVKRDGSAPSGVGLSITNPLGDGRTFAIAFGGASLIGGSLPDGAYRLVAPAALTADLAGNTLAADSANPFHRLFGDVNGNRQVDASELSQIKTMISGHGYASYFDYSNDGLVDLSDYQQMRLRTIRPLL